jgi:hypothetical protein
MTATSLLRAEEGLPRGVLGAADPRFADVVRIFGRLFPGRRFGGGALAVYIDGKPVVDVWTGWADRDGQVPWTANTGCHGVLRDEGGDSHGGPPPRRSWAAGLRHPRSPSTGRNSVPTRSPNITVRDVLRPPFGSVALKGVTKDDLLDHLLMEERLAAAPADHLRGYRRITR